MDHSPYCTSSPSSSPLLPTPSRQDKVITQRQYREKEGECFTNLRAIIHKLTGEVLQTRYEILTKAIELVLTLAETRMSKEMEVVYLETPFERSSPDLNTMTLGMGYSPETLLHPTVKPGAQTAHYFSHFPGQQYRTVPDANATLNQGGYYENRFNF